MQKLNLNWVIYVGEKAIFRKISGNQNLLSGKISDFFMEISGIKENGGTTSGRPNLIDIIKKYQMQKKNIQIIFKIYFPCLSS